MRIALDSNVFFDDLRMQKTYFQLLRRFLQLVPDCELITSRVTSFALLNHFQQELLFETTRAIRGTLNIADLTGRVFETQHSEFVEQETERYQTYLENTFRELGIQVILFRNLNYEDIVTRCFQRRNMLQDVDFKHILNWEALLQYGLEPGKQVTAITAKAQQLIVSEEPVLFDSDAYDCSAHNRFIQHLNPNLPEWRRIELCPTLYDFLNKHLTPLLELRHDKLNLLDGDADAAGFHAYLENWLKTSKQDLTVELEKQLDTLFAPSNIRPHKHSLRVHALDSSPSSITYMDVYALDARTLYWPIRIKLYVMMSFDADPESSTTVKNLDPTQAHLMAQACSSWFCNVFAKIEIPLQLSFIWDSATNTATHQQISFLPIQRWCPTCGEPFTDLSPATCPVCQNVWP